MLVFSPVSYCCITNQLNDLKQHMPLLVGGDFADLHWASLCRSMKQRMQVGLAPYCYWLSLLHACPSRGTRLTGKTPLMTKVEVGENKPNQASKFEAFDCVMFAVIAFAEKSHMAKFKVEVKNIPLIKIVAGRRERTVLSNNSIYHEVRR